MAKRIVDSKIKILAAVLFLMAVPFLLFTGCGSDRLVDQNEEQMGAIVESIQSGFAEEGWTYTGYELAETDEENDTATVLLCYDVEGDTGKVLKENTSEKADNDEIYGLAEDVNVKVGVELSVYDKENDTIGSGVTSTEWFVGDTEANEWIREQNKK